MLAQKTEPSAVDSTKTGLKKHMIYDEKYLLAVRLAYIQRVLGEQLQQTIRSGQRQPSIFAIGRPCRGNGLLRETATAQGPPPVRWPGGLWSVQVRNSRR